MWIVHFEYNMDNVNDVSFYNSETDAYKYACHQMMLEVKSSWDIAGDEDHRDQAKFINDHVLNGNWRRALTAFHDSDYNSDECAMYWHVYEQATGANFTGTVYTFPPSAFEDEEVEEGEAEELIDRVDPPSIKPPINNHTCPNCRNDRCSTAESHCWKCGAPI